MSSRLLTSPILRKPREYPFADIPLPIKLFVAHAIDRAWKRIRLYAGESQGDLRKEAEVPLNSRLEQCLNDMLDEEEYPEFSFSLFQHVVRGGEITSYDDRSLEKKPDLTFRLISVQPGIDRSSDRGLFVECKIVGPNHPIRDYCQKGLARFVSGEYAWAMPCGMMIGYAWEEFTVEGQLSPYLLSVAAEGLNLSFPPRLASSQSGACRLYESGHRRVWTRLGKSHGDITVFHLWLSL
ncbi:MAG: hypothetical protein ABJC13_10790 [Acidobacteriota bacterium]